MRAQVKTGAAEVAHRTITNVEAERDAAGGNDTRRAVPSSLTYEELLLKKVAVVCTPLSLLLLMRLQQKLLGEVTDAE